MSPDGLGADTLSLNRCQNCDCVSIAVTKAILIMQGVGGSSSMKWASSLPSFPPIFNWLTQQFPQLLFPNPPSVRRPCLSVGSAPKAGLTQWGGGWMAKPQSFLPHKWPSKIITVWKLAVIFRRLRRGKPQTQFLDRGLTESEHFIWCWS